MLPLIILLCAITGTLCFLASYAMHYHRGYQDGYHDSQVDHDIYPTARIEWTRYPHPTSPPSPTAHEP
jgi:hypothetical protein